VIAIARAQVFGMGLLAAGAVGCASGQIPARLTVPGEPVAPVTFQYQSSLFGGSGKLSTSLPSGERFAGGYTLTPKDAQSHMMGTLSGDRGTMLICRFRLNEPGIGPDRGGLVRCELSTGGTVDGQF
jgi:hypothetical protein